MLHRVLSLSLISLVASAGVQINGRVTSDTFAPVGGATVTLLSSSGERTTALTDPTGSFAITIPSAGSYDLTVERQGFFTLVSRKVEATPGIELSLVLNTVREFAEVVDVGTPVSSLTLDQTGSRTALSGTELLDVPYPQTHNFKTAMRILPGIVQDSSGGVHVNGANENQTLYLLDGFNIADPLTGKLESRVSVEAVQSMEVVSGQVPAEYGKGSSGVLRVNTKMGDDRLRYSATNFIPGIDQAKGLRIGSWNPRFNLSGPIVRGRAWFSDSITTQYDQTVVRELPSGQDQSTTWRTSNMFRVQFNATPSNILYSSFLATDLRVGRAGLTPLDPAPTTTDRRARQWFATIKDQHYFGHGALVEFGYASNRTFARMIPQGSLPYQMTPFGRGGNYFLNGEQDASRDQTIANLFLPALHFLGEHQIKTGTDLDRLAYTQNLQRTGIDFYGVNAIVRRVTFDGSGRVSQNNFEASVYLQDSWRLRANVLLDLGFRADWDRLLGNWNMSPRAGLAWAPFGLENTKISLGYSIAYDATNLLLFTQSRDQTPLITLFPPYGAGDTTIRSAFVIPRGELASPRFRIWSAAWDQRLAGGVFLKLQAIHRRGSRGLTYRPQSNDEFDLSSSRADAYDSGEITIRQNFRKRYEWLASYTRSRAASNAVIDLTVDQPLIATSNVGRLSWDTPNRFLSWGYLPAFFKNWAIAYLGEYRTGFPYSAIDQAGRIVGPANAYRYPDYFDLDLHIERTFEWRGQRWALRAGMNNITGHRNPNAVINDVDSPQFGTVFGGQSRASVFRIRWLGKL